MQSISAKNQPEFATLKTSKTQLIFVTRQSANTILTDRLISINLHDLKISLNLYPYFISSYVNKK